MKLGAEPMETPRFGAIAAVSRSRSTRWSIQAHCQRSYVRVEILKNESLHAQGRARGRQNDFFDPRLSPDFDHFLAAAPPARPAGRRPPIYWDSREFPTIDDIADIIYVFIL